MALNFKLGTLIMKVSVWSMKISVWSMEISVWSMKIRMSNTKEPHLPRLTSVSSVLTAPSCSECLQFYPFDFVDKNG